jgi:oligopeptide transport system ATP-binding protein
VEQAAAKALYEHPLHPYTQALFSSAPQPDPERKRVRLVLKGEAPSPVDPPPGCPFHPRCTRFVPGTCDVSAPSFDELPRGSGHKVACFNPNP